MPDPNHAPRQNYIGDDSHALACGALVDEVLEQVADGSGERLTDHQHQCPHCQTAITELTRIWSPVRRLADEPVRVPHRLKASVMRHVDTLIHDVGYSLELTDAGTMRVAARVITAIARDTARRVPGVRMVLGRARQSLVTELVGTHNHRPLIGGVGVLGRTAVVDLAVAVTYGEQVHHVAREIQRRVKAELQNNVGLQTVAVNVSVDDVLPRRENRPR